MCCHDTYAGLYLECVLYRTRSIHDTYAGLLSHTHTSTHMCSITPVGKPMPALVPAVGDLLASRYTRVAFSIFSHISINDIPGFWI